MDWIINKINWYYQLSTKCFSIGIFNSSCELFLLIFIGVIALILLVIEDSKLTYFKYKFGHLLFGIDFLYLSYYLRDNHDIFNFWTILLILIGFGNIGEFSSNFSENINKGKKANNKIIKSIEIIPILLLGFWIIYEITSFLNSYFTTRTLNDAFNEVWSIILNLTINIGIFISALIILVIVCALSLGLVIGIGGSVLEYLGKITKIENKYERRWKIFIFFIIGSIILYFGIYLENYFFPYKYHDDIRIFWNLGLVFWFTSAFGFVVFVIQTIFDKISELSELYNNRTKK